MKNIYKANDCGAFGKTTERALKEFLGLKVKVAKQGCTDVTKSHVRYEVKTGAGELGNLGEKLVKGSSMVIYVPVVDMDADIEHQQGYVMPKEVFLDVLDACGLIREKTSTEGIRKVTIQTFWIASKNKPHGRKYFRLVELLEENCDMTLAEWLAQYR